MCFVCVCKLKNYLFDYKKNIKYKRFVYTQKSILYSDFIYNEIWSIGGCQWVEVISFFIKSYNTHHINIFLPGYQRYLIIVPWVYDIFKQEIKCNNLHSIHDKGYGMDKVPSQYHKPYKHTHNIESLCKKNVLTYSNDLLHWFSFHTTTTIIPP